MNTTTPPILVVLLLFTLVSMAQVGINTTSPSDGSIMDVTSTEKGILIPRVDILDLATIAPVTGGSTESLLVYNTNVITGPGFFFWDGIKWVKIKDTNDVEPPIDSVTLTTDELINSATWTNVPSMSLTFTARKTSVLVNLSGSGFAIPASIALIEFRINNTTSGSIVGGTTTTMQTYVPGIGTSTPWSVSFSKMISGLTIGDSYTLVVQSQVAALTGFPDAGIFVDTNPDQHHLTLSVMH